MRLQGGLQEKTSPQQPRIWRPLPGICPDPTPHATLPGYPSTQNGQNASESKTLEKVGLVVGNGGQARPLDGAGRIGRRWRSRAARPLVGASGSRDAAHDDDRAARSPTGADCVAGGPLRGVPQSSMTTPSRPQPRRWRGFGDSLRVAINGTARPVGVGGEQPRRRYIPTDWILFRDGPL